SYAAPYPDLPPSRGMELDARLSRNCLSCALHTRYGFSTRRSEPLITAREQPRQGDRCSCRFPRNDSNYAYTIIWQTGTRRWDARFFDSAGDIYAQTASGDRFSRG